MRRETSQARYFLLLQAKLEQGAREHGERSFELSGAKLIDELQAECLDIAGWGWILWDRLERLRARVAELESATPDR